MLHEQANENDRIYLESLYIGEEVAAGEIATVMTMLDRAGVHDACQRNRRALYTSEAAALLTTAHATGPAAASLTGLIETMAGRSA